MSDKQNDPKKVGGLNTNYVLNGKAGEVKHLIYHRHSPKDGEVVVFVDNDLELDWECDDNDGVLIDAMPLKAAVRKILNGVAALEPVAHSWLEDLKLPIPRIISLLYTKDRSFEARCDELLMKTQLKAHPHFKDRYPVKYTRGGVEEEYVFSHALANGTIECLFQRFSIPKTKGRIQKSRDAMAWTLESLINGKVVTSDQAVLIVDDTLERQSETEVEKTLRLLGGMSRLRMIGWL